MAVIIPLHHASSKTNCDPCDALTSRGAHNTHRQPSEQRCVAAVECAAGGRPTGTQRALVHERLCASLTERASGVQVRYE